MIRTQQPTVGMPVRLLAIFIMCALIGCGSGGGGGGGGGGNGGGGSDENQPELARVLNAAPTSSLVEVRVEELILADNLPYGEMTVYTDVLEGEQRVRVRRRIDVAPTVDAKQTFVPGATTTLVVTQTLATDDSAGGLPQLVTLNDDNSRPDPGQIRLRILNVTLSEPALTVYLTGPNTSLRNAVPVATDLATGSATTSYLDADAGTFRIRAERKNEVTSSSSSAGSASSTPATTQVYDSGALTFEPNTVYTFAFLNRSSTGNRITAFLFEDKAYN